MQPHRSLCLALLLGWSTLSLSQSQVPPRESVSSDDISVADGWQHGPAISKPERWEVSEIGRPLGELLIQVPAPAPVYGA